jgi:hypothetical protein
VRTVRTQVKEGVSCTDLCEARLRFLALVAYNRQNPRLRFLTPAVLNDTGTVIIINKPYVCDNRMRCKLAWLSRALQARFARTPRLHPSGPSQRPPRHTCQVRGSSQSSDPLPSFEHQLSTKRVSCISSAALPKNRTNMKRATVHHMVAMV